MSEKRTLAISKNKFTNKANKQLIPGGNKVVKDG